MIISESQKYIFIHIPKTGGTSISISLEEDLKYNDIVLGGTKYGEKLQRIYKKKFGLHKHSTAYKVKEVVGDVTWDNYFKFSTVRHPITRIISIYSYLEKKLSSFWGEKIKHSHPLSPLMRSYIKAKTDINKALKQEISWLLKWNSSQAYLETKSFSEFIRHPKILLDLSFKPQWFWVSDDSQKELIVDQIYKLENINSQWIDLSSKIGFNGTLKHSNRSSSKSIAINSEDRQYLAEIFKVDFEKFDYDID
jgi:hypothetical protein